MTMNRGLSRLLLRFLLPAVMACLPAASPLAAQTPVSLTVRGALQNGLTPPTALAGALVSVRSAARNATVTGATGADGSYSATFPPAGGLLASDTLTFTVTRNGITITSIDVNGTGGAVITPADPNASQLTANIVATRPPPTARLFYYVDRAVVGAGAPHTAVRTTTDFIIEADFTTALEVAPKISFSRGVTGSNDVVEASMSAQPALTNTLVTLASDPPRWRAADPAIRASADRTVFFYRGSIAAGFDGNYTVTLSNVRDIALNDLRDPPANNVFVVDTTPPVVTAQVAPTGPGGHVRAGALALTALFSEDLNPLSTPTIAVVRSATSGNTLAPSPMTLVTPTRWQFSGYTVSAENVAAGIRDGDATIVVRNVLDRAGNPSAGVTAGATFVIDTVPPQVTLSYGAANPLRLTTGPLTVTATFTDAISDQIVVAPRFQVVSTTPGAATTVFDVAMAQLDDLVFQTTINIPSGLNGSFRAVVSGGLDRAGNANLQPFSNATLLIDTQRPSVAALAVPGQGSGGVSTGPIQIRVRFDEPMSSASTITVGVRRNGSADVTQVLAPSALQPTSDPTAWLSPAFTIPSGIDGSLVVTITGGADLNGNVLNPFTNPDAFVADTVRPQVASVQYSRNPAGAGTVTITATFTEPLGPGPSITVDRPPYGFGAGDLAAASMSATALASVWTISVPITASVTGGPQDGTVLVSIGGGTDSAGNEAITTSSSFVVDTTRPRSSFSVAAAANGCAGAGSPVGPGVATFTVSFDEPVVSTPAISIDRPGTGNDVNGQAMTAVTPGPQGSTSFTFAYDITAANGTTVFDGRVTFGVTNALDAAGNGATALTSASFAVDTSAPGLCISLVRGRTIDCSSAASAPPVTAGPICVTATFSEPIAPGCTPRVSFQSSGACLAGLSDIAMQPTARPEVWTYCDVIPARCNSCPTGDQVTIVVSAASDRSGNVIANTSLAFRVDDTPPDLVSFVSSSRTAHVPAGSLVFTATFSETPASPPAITINRPPVALGTANDVVAGPMTLSGSTSSASSCPTVASTWTFTWLVARENRPGTLDRDPSCSLTALSLSVTDAAGNASTVFPSFASADQPATLSTGGCAGIQIDTLAPTVQFSFGHSDTGGDLLPVDPDFIRTGALGITATFTDNILSTPPVAPVLSASGGTGTSASNDFSGQTMAALGSGAFFLSRTIVRGDDGAFKLTVAADDRAGNRAQIGTYSVDAAGNPFVVPARSTYGIDTSTPSASVFALAPSRPAGVTLFPRPLSPPDRSELTVALSSGPVDVVVTFAEPLQITRVIPGTVPAPIAPAVELARPRGGTPATATTSFVLVPVAATGATSATIWTTRIANIEPRGLPSFEDGRSVWGIVRGFDRAGNPFTGKLFETVIDTVAPVVSLSADTGSLTPDNKLVVAGTVRDSTRCVVTIAVPAAALSATFSVSPFAPGFRQELGPLPLLQAATLRGLEIQVSAVDLAGNAFGKPAGPVGLDTDGDGLSDDFETRATLERDGVASAVGLDARADDDSDGLSNLEEFRAGTNPLQRDTDDDGSDDLAELTAARNAPGTASPLDGADRRPVARLARPAPLRPVAPQILSLDGRASSDPLGRALGFRWALVSGPAGVSSPFVGLSATAPVALARLTAAGQYVFSLQVGNGSAFRSPPSTFITVDVTDLPPRARVRSPQVVEVPAMPAVISLDGSASADVNGSTGLAYSWRLVNNPGGGAALEGNLAGPAPLLRVSLPGSYAVELTVSDPAATSSAAASSTATAIVVAALAPAGQMPSFGPVARAGVAQRVVTTGAANFAEVALFGHDSVDPDRPTTDPLRRTLDFTWSQLEGPAPALLLPDARGVDEGDAARSVDPRARLFSPGRYRFRLTVSRAGQPQQASVPGIVDVEWVRLGSATAPSANAGLDRVVGSFDASSPPAVELNGSASNASSGGLVFRWTQRRTGPDDLTPEVALSDPSSPRPFFVPPAPGDYTFDLVVTDSSGLSSLPASVTVQVRTRTRTAGPAVTTAALESAVRAIGFASPARITGSTGPTIFLDASASGQGALTYEWRQIEAGSTAPPVAIANADGSRASFRPVVSGTYLFAVTVSDGVLSTEAKLAVPVDDLRAGRNSGVTPVLRVPASVQVPEDRDAVVTLDASASFDRDRSVPGRRASPLTYLWRQTAGPAFLAFDRTAAKPSLRLPAGIQGRFVFECLLDDGQDAVLATDIAFAASASSAAPPPASTAQPVPTRSVVPNATSAAAAGTGSSGGGCAMLPAGVTGSRLDLALLALAWVAIAIRRRNAKVLAVVAMLASSSSVDAAILVRGVLTDELGARRGSVNLTLSTTNGSVATVTNASGQYSAVLSNPVTNTNIDFFATIRGTPVLVTPRRSQILATEIAAGEKVQDLVLDGPVTTLSYSRSGTAFNAGSLTITATFSRPVFGDPNIAIDFAPVAATDIPFTSMTFTNGSTAATFTFTISSNTGDGQAVVRIAGAEDGPGRDALPPTDPFFTIDTVQPMFNRFAFSRPQTPFGTGAVTITATFNEAMAAPTLVLDAPDGFTDLRQQMLPADENRREFFLPYVIFSAPETALGLANVAIATGTDLAANGLANAPSQMTTTFTIDNRRPRGTLTVPPLGVLPERISGQRPITFQVDFDEPVAVATPPRIQVDQSGDGIQGFVTLVPSGVGATSTEWTTTLAVVGHDPSINFLDGTAKVNLAGGRDPAGNAGLFASTPTFELDSRSPRLRSFFNGKSSITPSVAAGKLTILVLADDAGTVTTPSIQIDPSLDTGASAGVMTRVTTNVFEFTATVSTVDGNPSPLTRTITISGAADDVGNPAISSDTTATFITDTRPLGVTLTRSPGGSRIGPCPVTLTATFDRPVVENVTLTVTTTSSVVLPLTTMTGPVPGTVFTAVLPIDASVQGTLTAVIAGPLGASGGGASDAAGNATTATTSFAVDSAGPEVALSFSRGVASAGTGQLLVTSGPLTITATFSEPVTTATTAYLAAVSCSADPATSATTSIALSARGPGSANDRIGLALQPTNDPAVWVTSSYAVSGSTTADPTDGTIVFDVGGAADAAGNLALPVAVSSASIRADTIAPAPAISISRSFEPLATGAVRFDATGSLTIQATYSEPLSGPAPALRVTGLVSAGTGSGSAIDLTTTMAAVPGGRVFTASLAGSSEATLTLRVSGGSDAAGNAAAAASSTARYDALAPTASLAYSSSTAPRIGPGPLVVTATFSEALASRPAIALVRVDGQTGVNTRIPTTMQPTADPKVFVSSFSIEIGEDAAYRFALSGATDAAGNSIGAVANADVTVDTTPATVVVSAVPGLQQPIGRGALTFTATFSEPLSSIPTLQIAGPIPGSAINTLQTTQWDATGSASVWVKLVEIRSGHDGLYTLELGNVRDRAGNLSPAGSTRFRVDTTGPRAAVSFNRGGGSTPVSSGPLEARVTLTEPVTPAPTSLTIVRQLQGAATQTYVVPLRPADTALSFVGTVVVTHAAGAAQAGDPASVTLLSPSSGDVSGNPTVLAGTLSIVLDTVAPTLSFTAGDGAQGAVPAGTVALRVSSGERLSAAPGVAVAPPGTDPVAGGAMQLAADARSASLGIVIPRHSPPAAADGAYRVALTGGADLAGNAARFSPAAVVDVIADTQPPVLTLDRPESGFFSSGQVPVSGEVADQTTVTVAFELAAAPSISPRSIAQARPPQGALAGTSRLPFAASVAADLPGCATTTSPVLNVQAIDSAGNRSALVSRTIVFDSDADGLPDPFECFATGGTSALDPARDDDSDGLSNLQEYLTGTLPRVADSDGDGIDDGTEVQRGSDPRNGSSTPAGSPGTVRLAARASTPAEQLFPQRVALNGAATASSSANLAYQWSCVAAPVATSTVNGAAVFAATRGRATAFADLGASGQYTFRLAVTDLAAQPAATAATEVAVTVLDVPPVARIDAVQDGPIFVDVTGGAVIVGLSSASFDANGDGLTFAWSARDGNGFPPAGLVFAGATDARDVQVQCLQPGAYEVSLTVRSTAPGGSLRSDTARRRIVAFATGSRPPVARAGFDRRVVVTADPVDVRVQLFGRDSVDPDRPTTDPLRRTLQFRWSQTAGATAGFSADARGTAEGDAAASVDPVVRITQAGRYRFSLVVTKASDPSLVSLPDEVDVTVVQLRPSDSRPPRASAGGSRVVAGFDAESPQPVTLDGSASRGSNDPSEALGFFWRQVRQEGDPAPAVELSDPFSVRPSFVPPSVGDYEFELVVTDRLGRESLPDRARLRVVNVPGNVSGNTATGVTITRTRALAGGSAAVRFDSPVRLSAAGGVRVDLLAEAQAQGGSQAPTYRWRQLRDGSTAPDVELATAATAQASFLAERSGTYRFEVRASVGALSATTVVVVPVDDLRAAGNSGVTPRVSFPSRVVVTSGRLTRVRLDASASFDRDASVRGRAAGRVTYFWSQAAGPAALAFDAALPRLDLDLPDLQGTYVFELQLDDGQDMVAQQIELGATASAAVQPPIAAAAQPAAATGGGGGGCSLTARDSSQGLFDLAAWFLMFGWLARRNRLERKIR